MLTLMVCFLQFFAVQFPFQKGILNHCVNFRMSSAVMDIDAEQRFHDLEERYISLKKEYDFVVVDKESQKGRIVLFSQ